MTDQSQPSPKPTVPEYGWSTKPAAGIARDLAPRIVGLAGRLGFAAPLRVLDVGCGNGYVGGCLLEAGYEVTGVDPSGEGVGIARARHPRGRWEQLEASEGLLERLGCGAFDVVISTEVVEHLYLPRSWARACLGCLRPGGLFICSTPYHGYLKNLLIAARGQWDKHADPLWDGGHIKLWSVGTLRRLLEAGGFEEIGWEGVGRVRYLWKSMLMHGRRPG